jgi:hypothetical protein
LKGLLYQLQIALSEELHCNVWQSLICSVDEENLEEDIVVVHLDEGLCVDGVRVAGQLVDLSIYLLSDVTKEIFLACRLC